MLGWPDALLSVLSGLRRAQIADPELSGSVPEAGPVSQPTAGPLSPPKNGRTGSTTSLGAGCRLVPCSLGFAFCARYVHFRVRVVFNIVLAYRHTPK